MKKLSLIIAAGLMAAVAQAQLIDSFSGNLSAYTATRILKATPAAANNVYSWEIDSGALRINTTTYGGIEQYALTRNDFTLGVGFELTTSYSHLNLGSQDLGLYVGAGTPTADVRADYVNVYVRNNGQIFSRGFNGASELTLSGGSTPANISSLFIARTSANIYELGYYDGATRNLLATRTMANSAIGNAIGFYADVRAVGIRGTVDNLTLTAVPEPTSAALLGLGSLGFLFRLRRK
jgi:hypothetical protein